MNPLRVVYWVLAGFLLGLAPRLVLGWPWWAAVGTGMLTAPPLLWLGGAALDRYESGAPTLSVPAPPAATPALELEPAPACPKCGGGESAFVLYGLPAFTDELKQAIDDKRVVLAGCGEKHGPARQRS